jgi:cytidine deaminase
MSDISDMLAAANAVRSHAYAPYSGFAVGACLKGRSGRLYAGCNVENAAYPEGHCAESGAIAVMVAAGEREIAAILVVADSPEPCSPCGGCRQRLAEFAGPATPVHLCAPDGLRLTVTLGELLPHSFGPKHLDKR